MKNTKEVLEILPQSIKSLIEDSKVLGILQEIRMKVNKPLILQIGKEEKVFSYEVTSEDIRGTIQRISKYSIYAFEEELKQGYITVKGGHRVGICGSCVIEKNSIKTIKSIASLNIRICREILGASNLLMPFILDKNRVQNTIIISPPKCGKTTLLRDITKKLSDGIESHNIKGKKVCVIDERSEIGGCFNGVPQMELGIRTDILDNCPKSEGIMMAIRSMSPDVIVCDEIGTYKDVEAILMALNSGVNLVTTIHGNNIEDLYKRAVFKELIDNNVFKRAVILSGVNGAGTIENIFDLENNTIVWRR